MTTPTTCQRAYPGWQFVPDKTSTSGVTPGTSTAQPGSYQVANQVCGGKLVSKGSVPDAGGFPRQLLQCEKCRDVTFS